MNSMFKIIRENDNFDALLEIFRTEPGTKVVFTNGCFDLLHAGHVQFLNEAKMRGTILVVGLNSDRSVKELKGKDRPLNTWDDRAIVLAGLQTVDLVIKFDDEAELAWLIETLKPAVLCKGQDYHNRPITGEQLVRDRGGEVCLLPTRRGFSTTNVIKAIRGETVPEKDPAAYPGIDISGG